MDLVQIGGSLVSIVILALLAWWLFPSKAELTKERVTRNVARYCADAELNAESDQIYLGKDKKNAILVFHKNRFGIATATALGDRVVVRHFPNLAAVNFRFENGKLSLKSDDFTQPSFIITLDPAEISSLLSAVNVTPQKEANHAHA